MYWSRESSLWCLSVASRILLSSNNSSIHLFATSCMRHRAIRARCQTRQVQLSQMTDFARGGRGWQVRCRQGQGMAVGAGLIRSKLRVVGQAMST